MQAHVVRGVLYEQIGSLELAMADYHDALKIDPAFAAAHRHRAALDTRLNKAPRESGDRAECNDYEPNSQKSLSTRVPVAPNN